MAKSYRPVDRDQQFLLAPDMREWLESGHLVWLVLDAVEAMDTSGFHRARARRRTAGSRAGQAGYDPDMLLGLLIYAYCVGERSSRGIESKCHTDVAFRVACAQDVPDHTVIARFRREFHDVFADVFSQVLGACARVGMVKVGVVAVDGTKIEANAALAASKTEKWLRDKAAAIVAEAEAVDTAEDRDAESGHDDDPRVRARLADPVRRRQAIAEAIASIEGERAEHPDTRLAVQRLEWALEVEARATAKASATWQARQDRIAAGQRPAGRVPYAPDEHPLVLRARRGVARRRARLEQVLTGRVWRRNLTDPQSRVMSTRKGFVQGYNAQVVVSEDHVILASQVSNNPLDNELYVPMITAAQAELDRLAAAGHEREIGTVLADAGYFSVTNLTAQGPDRIIAFGKKHALDREQAPPSARSERDPAIEAMRERFGDEATRQTYRRRGAIVEPVNGHLKDRRGLRRFAMRGIDYVRGEFHLAAAATNLMRYTTFTTAPAGA